MNNTSPQPQQTECPKCHEMYLIDFGALSRKDNETMICSACGTREAMEAYLTYRESHE